MAFTGVGTAAGQVASGVKVIASAGKRRPTLMPHVPTVIESGYPDYYAGSWFGVMATAGTPPVIVYLLSRKLAEVASSAQYQQHFLISAASRPSN